MSECSLSCCSQTRRSGDKIALLPPAREHVHDGHLWTYPTVSVNTREHPLRSAQGASNGRSEDIAGLSDEIRRMAAKGAASTMLALAENLPKIVDLTDQIAE